MVDAQQPARLHRETKLFGHLAHARLQRRLAGFERAAGQLPARLVDRLDDQDAAANVPEQARRGHLQGGQTVEPRG